MHPRLRHLRLRFASATAALLVAAGAAAQTAPAADGGLGTSADYIARFVQYVRWPGEDDIDAWQVCVAATPGDDPAAYSGQTARGKPFSARRVAAADAVADCQVLDLTTAPPADSKVLLGRARRLSILTVGTGESFCSAGGTVCLRPSSEGGGFEINLSAAQASRLNVNAQLLMLGRKRQIAGTKP
jgi:hypothetical protein